MVIEGPLIGRSLPFALKFDTDFTWPAESQPIWLTHPRYVDYIINAGTTDEDWADTIDIWRVWFDDEGLMPGREGVNPASTSDYWKDYVETYSNGGPSSYTENTLSAKFAYENWMAGDATTVNVFDRAANGSGSADAWTISTYFKAGSAVDSNQTLLYYGGNDVTYENHLHLKYVGWSGFENLWFRYGSNSNYLMLITPANSIVRGTWQHLMITYDGGTTGTSSGAINDSYSRFKIFIDGVQVATTNLSSGYGTSRHSLGEPVSAVIGLPATCKETANWMSWPSGIPIKATTSPASTMEAAPLTCPL